MADVMVTSRMSDDKKRRALRVLDRYDINPSKAINIMFDKIIAENNIDFLVDKGCTEASSYGSVGSSALKHACSFVDSLVVPISSRFDTMSKADIKKERAARSL